MKRLTAGIMALGSLVLLVGMIVVLSAQSANAQRDDTTYDECFAMQIIPAPCKGDKVYICHFNEGADFGRPHCQEPAGYKAHIGPVGHGEKDFCITSVSEIFECIGEEPPPPPPPCDPKDPKCEV